MRVKRKVVGVDQGAFLFQEDARPFIMMITEQRQRLPEFLARLLVFFVLSQGIALHPKVPDPNFDLEACVVGLSG